MNKAQLIAKLEATYEKVGTPVLVSPNQKDGQGNIIDLDTKIRTYDTPVFEVKNGAGLQKTVPFYVKDEGEATESAYLRHVETTTFKADLDAFIATKEGTGGIKKVVVTNLNEAKNFAEVTAYVLANGTVTKTNRLIIKEGATFEIYPLA